MFDQKSYNQSYYQKNKERIKKAARLKYQQEKDDPAFQEMRKVKREQRHFGVPLSVILRKNKGRCVYCDDEASLGHHLDDDGRTNEKTGKKPGHDVSRIVPVCRPCHLDLHRYKMMLSKKTRANGYWSRNYDCCIECGTKDRKHSGHGLCVNCAARARRKGAGV